MKINKIVRWISFGIVLASLQMQAQQQYPLRYMYSDYKYVFNPAALKIGKGVGLHANYSHNQFREGMPNNFLGGFGIEGGFLYDKMGLGLVFSQDNAGILKNTDVKLMYAYRVRLAKNHWLSFGLSAGVVHQGQNTGKIITGDFSDPLIGRTHTDFSGGFGIHYAWNEDLEIDFSIPSYNTLNKENIPLFASLSYNFKLSEGWRLKPVAMFHSVNPSANSFDFRLQPSYKEFVWLQVGYRTTKELLFAVGGGAKNFNVGVAYGFNLSHYNELNQGNFEILLAYRFAKAKLQKRKQSDIDGKLKTIDDNVVKLRESTEKQTQELEQITQSVKSLNDDLRNEFKGSLNEIKESVLSIQKDEVEVNEPKIIGKAYFVVVYSTTTREDADAIVYRMSKQNVEGHVIKDSKRTFFYIYTTAFDDLHSALSQAEQERKRGFSGAWVLILK